MTMFNENGQQDGRIPVREVGVPVGVDHFHVTDFHAEASGECGSHNPGPDGVDRAQVVRHLVRPFEDGQAFSAIRGLFGEARVPRPLRRAALRSPSAWRDLLQGGVLVPVELHEARSAGVGRSRSGNIVAESSTPYRRPFTWEQAPLKRPARSAGVSRQTRCSSRPTGSRRRGDPGGSSADVDAGA